MLRKKILVTGVVQGVGFRPFVYKEAVSLALAGYVKNTSSGVEIEIEGGEKDINKFLARLRSSAPAAAEITEIRVETMKTKKEKSFKISSSKAAKNTSVLIPPDLAVCKDCAKETADETDRRYAYALTNCTNCGPRLSITSALPYDRKSTAMKSFKMCPACAREYADPASRRFHAEPNACPVCGPKVTFVYGKNRNLNEFALQAAAEALKKGRIIAIKSIGGFHLACDASQGKTVRLLRKRKNRPDKPFALMFSGIKEIKEYCFVNKKEEELLLSPAAPLVTLQKKKELSCVADNLNTYAAMLPFTPMHKILFDMLGPRPLVMTSANISDRPIIIDNNEAAKEMQGIADGFLSHNREIYNRIDDSIVMELDGKTHVIRRARGLVPGVINLPAAAKKPLFAAGAEKTGAFCFAAGNKAYLSQYLGDQNIRENQRFYIETFEKTKKLLKITPAVFARDLHPDYFTSEAAGKRSIPVPHHAAHAMSAAAEHNIKEPFLAIVFDGSGLGADGNVWGGEFLVFEKNTWRRAAHFKYIPMIGGDEAVKQIWRLGLSVLTDIFGGIPDKARRLFAHIKRDDLKLAQTMLEKNINCPLVSSVGRMFDTVASLCGLMQNTTYQAQAAMEMEALYDAKLSKKNPLKIEIKKEGETLVLDPSEMFKKIISASMKPAVASSCFHDALINATVETAKKTDVKTVALSGGCFQNKVLLSGVTKGLQKAGFKVYANEKAPLGDGGIALGQAYALVTGLKESK